MPDSNLLVRCATRRAEVVRQLAAAGGGVALLPTAPEAMRNRDADYPYRHDSYFYYLTGFTEPHSLLALQVTASGSSRSATQAERALDAALEAVAASERRISAMEQQHAPAPAARKRRSAGA